MRFKYITKNLLISFILSLLFTFLTINYFKFNLSPFVVRGSILNVQSWVIPDNFSASKSSNEEFFNFILSKTRLPEVTFDQLFYQYSSELSVCNEFKSTQFIKNPFTSNRVTFNYNTNFSTLIIQIRHINPETSALCLNIISNLIEGIYIENLNYAINTLINLQTIKSQYKSKFLRNLKLNGISDFEYNKILRLDDTQLNFIFNNKDIKSLTIIQKSKLSLDKMNTFNLFYEESTKILEYLNSIYLSSNFYSVRSANYSLFRIIQIFMCFLFINFIMIFIIKKYCRQRRF
jgi:hypothetical protein